MQQYSGEIFRLLHGKIKNHSVSSVPISISLSVSCFQCAEIIKNMMDESYGGAGYWNVIVGESFDVCTSLLSELLNLLSQIFSDQLFL